MRTFCHQSLTSLFRSFFGQIRHLVSIFGCYIEISWFSRFCFSKPIRLGELIFRFDIPLRHKAF
jgi:hypothetical protein